MALFVVVVDASAPGAVDNRFTQVGDVYGRLLTDKLYGRGVGRDERGHEGLYGPRDDVCTTSFVVFHPPAHVCFCFFIAPWFGKFYRGWVRWGEPVGRFFTSGTFRVECCVGARFDGIDTRGASTHKLVDEIILT